MLLKLIDIWQFLEILNNDIIIEKIVKKSSAFNPQIFLPYIFKRNKKKIYFKQNNSLFKKLFRNFQIFFCLFTFKVCQLFLLKKIK